MDFLWVVDVGKWKAEHWCCCTNFRNDVVMYSGSKIVAVHAAFACLRTSRNPAKFVLIC